MKIKLFSGEMEIIAKNIPKDICDVYFQNRFWRSSLFTGAVYLGVGAYIGYNHAKNIPLDHKLALAITPAVVQGGLDSLRGFCFMIGSAASTNSTFSISKNQYGELVEGLASVATMGALKGGLETAVGYGLGYTTGKIF
ncbi:hypothetical protein HZA97_04430 [Candidatus Woesearchaeota archaeon]|nr:hypothetical protein [Candidatus Woesearchaeota archaeon]